MPAMSSKMANAWSTVSTVSIFNLKPPLRWYMLASLAWCLQILQDARERGALEVGTLFIGYKRRDEFAAFEHEFFHAQQLRDPTEANGAQQFFGFIWKWAKAILESVSKALQVVAALFRLSSSRYSEIRSGMSLT